MLVGELFARLGLQKQDYDRGIDDAKSQLQSVGVEGEKSSGIISRAFSAVGPVMTGVAVGGIAAVAGGLVGAAYEGLNFNSSMEQVTAKLNAFTKDGAKSAEILEMIRDRASKTPFEFEQMAQATTSLMSASKGSGVELEYLVEQAEILAASNPAEGLEGAAYALKEAVGGDFTSAIERFDLPRQLINDLKEQGIPNVEIVRQAMLAMGYDTDLVANLANTASGRWSTFKDTLTTVAAQVTQPIFDVFSSGLASVNDWLTNNQDKLHTFAELLAGAVATGLDFIANTAIPALIAAYYTLEPAFAFVFSLFSEAGTQSGVLGEALHVLGGVWGSLQALISVIAPSIQEIVTAVFSFIQSFLAQHGDEIAALLTKAWQIIQSLVELVTAALQNIIFPAFSAIASFIQAHGDTISAIINAAWTVISNTITIALALIQGVINTALAIIKGDWQGAWGAIKTMLAQVWESMQALVSAAVSLLASTLSLAWDAIAAVAGAAWEAIKGLITSLFESAVQSVINLVNGLASTLSGAWNSISGTASDQWNSIKTTITSLFDSAVQSVTSLVTDLTSTLSGAWNSIYRATSTAWVNIQTEISRQFSIAKQSVDTTVSAIEQALATAWDTIESGASSAWYAIAGVIESAFSSAISGIEGVLNDIIGVMNDAIDAVNSLPGPDVPTIPYLAKGTDYFMGGPAIVGEQGPELVYLPRGTQVIPNNETERLLAGQTGSRPQVVNNYNVTANYTYQPERSLREDVALFQLLGAGV